ncbi:hypothetical protein [Paenibacillus sp. FSL H8-0537]|uniref:hypothetical protein n=1 Tax=Paenibacillus sp. FSL H8-0537 TaxID=2921399 RepID=UPI0031016B39
MGKMEEHLIKLQHNCVSDRRHYASNQLIRIMHEHVLIFRKNDCWVVPLRVIRQLQQDLRESTLPTWRDLVQAALEHCGKSAPLEDLYQVLESTEKAKRNPHWKKKFARPFNSGKNLNPFAEGLGN